MSNSIATFNLARQPVLPLNNLLGQETAKIAPSAIGVKIKSFKIEEITKRVNQTVIELPNFAELDSYLCNEDIVTSFVTPVQSDLPTVKRFWWHWLLSTSRQISILVLLILLQSYTQASSLLNRAKIYTDLSSQQVAAIPPSGTAYLQGTQASPFNRAIYQASAIEPDSLFYPQAQEDISRWSKTILDIAKGRAGEGDLTGAIAAAKLVPQDQTETESIAKEATQAMAEWKLRANQKDRYQQYLQEAKAVINPARASSYSQAIAIMQQINPDAAEYHQAQSLINRWNEQIYLIVKQRVAQGNFKQAVEAAILVSEDSSYYQLAQDSINTRIKSIYGAAN